MIDMPAKQRLTIYLCQMRSHMYLEKYFLMLDLIVIITRMANSVQVSSDHLPSTEPAPVDLCDAPHHSTTKNSQLNPSVLVVVFVTDFVFRAEVGLSLELWTRLWDRI